MLQINKFEEGTLYIYSSYEWVFTWNDKTTIAEIERLLNV